MILTIEGILTECMTKAKQFWRRGGGGGGGGGGGEHHPTFTYNKIWSNLQDMEGESKRFGFFMTEREISKFLFNH